MKTIVHFFGILLIGMSMNSCIIETDFYNRPSLEQVMTDYDIWYVDYNRTTGSGNVPFISKAFTLSFMNGRMYANNNIVGIGFTGNGYGVQKGTYNTNADFLRVYHNTDGVYDFDIIVDSPSRIRLYNSYYNVTYYLIGYQINSFDFDQIFYDNIEYFLQEYKAWAKTYTSTTGTVNVFDNENLLAFTPENNTTFYSSQDSPSTPLNDIYWDFTGSYEVLDVNGYDNLKYLRLFYDSNDYEEFELVVLNDSKIELYHISSGTTYEFSGRSFIAYKMASKTTDKTEVSERPRTIINRKTVERSNEAIENRK